MRQTAALLAAAMLAAPLAVGASAQSLDLPPRRVGLWDITTVIEKPKAIPAVTSQVCLDAATDREFMEFGLQVAGSCKRLTSTREGKNLIVDAECTIAGKTTRTKAVFTGDFQSAYTLRLEGTMERGGDKQRAMLTTQTATWKRVDCPGMKPGDMTMFGGIKVNIKQMKGLSGLIR